ncbi:MULTISPECIES: recombinase family protein [unclassified Clostridioides]|uniref:recombinase family protein n=1 Tax=unclassified Clostridioides TaxID=2635829 RepID=UPI001D1149E8|nr:recombinase family protein [Clostridioides sp. ES-S-0171-01]MCC0688858.1 recombinase family protein [Clostridioides sp. ES-S-0056-01]UDN53519.1 recombinase family protein [Clostridioides sp. ES-S-0054-01]
MDNRIDAIYGRQSIDKKDSISIESQFEFCRYELKGGEGNEYKDKGYSGKNIDRPDFQRLLGDIKAGLIKRVVVYKLDRISRSIVDFAKLMEIFKQYNVEFVSCTEKFDTSTPMGRAMLNICIVFAQLERESIQMRVTDAFYSRCAKSYYMRGRAAYGFDLEPIVMDGIKTKKLVENAEMDYVEMMFEMYGEPETSYGDITRYFTTQNILVYGKTLKRGFLGQLLRNPVYVQADMDIYEYFKAQGVKIESPPELFTGDYGCYLYQGREGEEPILVITPHKGRIPSGLWLSVQRKLSQNTTFQNGRKCHNTWLAGKIKCGCCGYALASLNAPNGVTYLRCKQRSENKGCQGAGTLTKQVLEQAVYAEMVKKMRAFQTLKGTKTESYNPKLTVARAALAKTEAEIEKLLDTLSGANPTLLQYANSRIEELDGQRQAQAKLVADLTTNSVSSSQVESISGYLRDWESVDFDDKRRVLDTLVLQVRAISEQVVIHWKL